MTKTTDNNFGMETTNKIEPINRTESEAEIEHVREEMHRAVNSAVDQYKAGKNVQFGVLVIGETDADGNVARATAGIYQPCDVATFAVEIGIRAGEQWSTAAAQLLSMFGMAQQASLGNAPAPSGVTLN